MKRTLTINLGGRVYNIDEDAYAMLDDYLTNLRQHFQYEEGAEEIVRDIESRISELFNEYIKQSKQVVSIEDVEEVIVRMGKPEDFSEDEEDISQDNKTENPGTTSVKRLYRDIDHKEFGGVLSGIAAYTDWDKGILRLCVLVAAFFLHWIVLAYLLAWVIIPPARGVSEKLSMRGMKINMENIGKTVTDNWEKVNNYVQSNQTQSLFHRIISAIIDIASFLIKCFLVFLLICSVPFLFVLLIICFSLLMVSVGVATALPTIFYEALPLIDWDIVISSPISLTLMSISGILLITIPIVCLVHLLMSSFSDWKPMSFSFRILLTLIWLCSLGAVFFFLINLGFSIY